MAHFNPRYTGIKCLIFLIVAVCVLCATINPAWTAQTACAGPEAADYASHWAKDYICTLMDEGLLTGYPDGSFRPDATITRQEFAAILARAKGYKVTTDRPPHFCDVGPELWSYDSIQALVEAGIFSRDDFGEAFNPSLPVTRAEIAMMLVRASELEKEVNKKASLASFVDPIPAWASGYVTVALNHGLVTGYGDGTFRPAGRATRAEAGLMVLRMLDPKVRPATWVERYTYPSKTGTNTVKVIRVNFNRDDIQIRPALAGTIRETASLGAIAQNAGAIAAINGTYFSAYSNADGDLGEPYNALAIDGHWVHGQMQGTCLGITWDKRVIMDPIRMLGDGYTNGCGGRWGVWSWNHNSPNIIGVFDSYRGETTQMTGGVTYTVRDGQVISKGGPDVPVPKGGYVIFVSDSMMREWTDEFFPIGGKVEVKMRFTDHKDQTYPNSWEWQQIQHAIGCGPRLVTAGIVTVNPVAERYTEEKQTTLSCNRGGVGVTTDNIVSFVTCTSLTPQEFGELMADLGNWNAMQMDSGGSSALWYDGAYLTGPGRNVNNGLVVIQE